MKGALPPEEEDRGANLPPEGNFQVAECQSVKVTKKNNKNNNKKIIKCFEGRQRASQQTRHLSWNEEIASQARQVLSTDDIRLTYILSAASSEYLSKGS